MDKYSKFIEIEKKDSSEFRFITRSISDDETRYFMNFAFCEDNKLIATDGRRLHILDLGENIYGFNEKKFYRSLKSTNKVSWFVELSEDPGQFPNYKKVIPDTSGFKIIDYSGSRNLFGSSVEISKLLRAIPDDLAINLKYLNDFPVYNDWKVNISNNGIKPIVFESEKMKAVIMPMDVT